LRGRRSGQVVGRGGAAEAATTFACAGIERKRALKAGASVEAAAARPPP
jgi:hypothetical protein